MPTLAAAAGPNGVLVLPGVECTEPGEYSRDSYSP